MEALVRRLLMILCPLLLVVEGSWSAGASRPPGWDDATHGRDAVPDYDLCFPPIVSTAST